MNSTSFNANRAEMHRMPLGMDTPVVLVPPLERRGNFLTALVLTTKIRRTQAPKIEELLTLSFPF
jgi:hypothetical protein